MTDYLFVLIRQDSVLELQDVAVFTSIGKAKDAAQQWHYNSERSQMLFWGNSDSQNGFQADQEGLVYEIAIVTLNALEMDYGTEFIVNDKAKLYKELAG